MTNVLEALRAAFAHHGEPTLAEAVRLSCQDAHVASRDRSVRLALADWVCRTLVPLAMDAAELTIDARSLRDMPPVIDGDDVCRQRLEAFVAARACDAETSAYENHEYRTLITILDADDSALLICSRAVGDAVGTEMRVIALASRAILQLVGPAVVDYDYWRARSMSVPAGCSDAEADRECDRAEERYRRFFELDTVVRASFERVLRALDSRT